MASVSATTPATLSKEILQLQKEIFTIYLEPLLKIHNNYDNNATTASMVDNEANVITYEDLTSSFQLAVASLGKLTTNVDVNGKNFVVRFLLFFLFCLGKPVSYSLMLPDTFYFAAPKVNCLTSKSNSSLS